LVPLVPLVPLNEHTEEIAMIETTEKLITVVEAATIADVTKHAVDYWVDRHKFNTVWAGNCRLISEKEFMAFLELRKTFTGRAANTGRPRGSKRKK
jgi:hypothetical protein